jgi:hypothetical protein
MGHPIKGNINSIPGWDILYSGFDDLLGLQFETDFGSDDDHGEVTAHLRTNSLATAARVFPGNIIPSQVILFPSQDGTSHLR